MKICDSCGAYNSDDRGFCVDCGEKLGDKISEKAEKELDRKMNEISEKMYNKTDPLYVSVFDRTVGTVSLVCLLLLFIICAAALFRQQSVIFSVYGFICLILSAVEAFFPKVNWEIEKFRLSFRISNPDDAEPSDFYRIMRKLSEIILCAVGIAVLAVGIFAVSRPPVVKYINIIAEDGPAISSHTKDYINSNPELWEKIIDGGSYTVDTFIEELEKSGESGLEEKLMIQAVCEIEGLDDSYMSGDTSSFLYKYLMRDFEIITETSVY